MISGLITHQNRLLSTSHHLSGFAGFIFKLTAFAWHLGCLYSVYSDGLSILTMYIKQLPELVKAAKVCLCMYFCVLLTIKHCLLILKILYISWFMFKIQSAEDSQLTYLLLGRNIDSLMNTEPDSRIYQQVPISSGLK